GASLVVVLGHDSCGAVAAAADALTTGRMPTGFVRAIVDRVIPSIVTLPEPGSPTTAGRALLAPTPEALGREHVRHTVEMLQSYSVGLTTAVAEGRCAILGVEYTLADGRIRLVQQHGSVAPTV
ncbi:MAG TPA: carbonic anhydrase, partial [Actinotalea sp.]|nr:carbonic anhydrase [Actinotalea sp.]